MSAPDPFASAIEVRDAIARGETTAEAICAAVGPPGVESEPFGTMT